MTTLAKAKLGLVFGSFLGGFHLTWVVLVALGWAQPLADFVFRLHFIDPPYRIMPFQFGTAAGLVMLTFVIGLVSGWVFAAIWNTLVPIDQRGPTAQAAWPVPEAH